MLNNQKATNFGFDVDPNENYLYFIPNMSSLCLSVLNATDGMYVSSRASNSYQIIINSVVLTASPDNSTVYFTSTNGYFYLWKTTSSDLNFYWVTFVPEGGAHKILALDSYQLFINIEYDAGKLSLVKRIEFNNTSVLVKWANKIVCYQAVDATKKSIFIHEIMY